ncbi:outer membrane lipoprotein-sorting protein [Azohydromonas sediminis]|uniref:outer membrane lipoprotein-sorting protein n=1 Tax=Azohydromonas sediminis TaxID=2259674 RepID=UPI000E65DB36|nr:outer membrane lipoprotein-sorting protein [Azohydromonas sediminis]
MNPNRFRAPTFRALGQALVAAFRAGLAATLAVAWLAAHADDEATRLAQAVHERPAGRDVTTLSRMELIEKGRAPRVRELVTYRQVRANGETAYLLRFLGPEDIAGTGLLSIDKSDGANDQWLYLPALDRVRRVAGDRKGGRFAGSELYFEDLQERRPTLDRHRLLGREMLDGVACEVLESVPVDPANSVYRRRVSWVDPQTLLVLRVDYFERDPATPSKRWLLVDKKRIQGYWTVTDSRMIDLDSGRVTRLVVETAKYDRRLPARLFNPQALADERLEADHRP